jgi:hypothetical protein
MRWKFLIEHYSIGHKKMTPQKISDFSAIFDVALKC